MASLKEIKGRIASVGNTLKITSAMKMVSSAKLHRAQSAATALAAYDRALKRLGEAVSGPEPGEAVACWFRPAEHAERVAVVAMASDSSLCGSFNNNAIKALQALTEELRAGGCNNITLYPVGEKMAQAVAKSGGKADYTFRALMGESNFQQTADLADLLIQRFLTAEYDRVVLLHNHFYSMGRQAPICEEFLPLTSEKSEEPREQPFAAEYLLEPKAEELSRELIPYLLRTRLHTAILDSLLAEHAARMVAMQTATDNASALLEELRLSYNKRRQQAITEELADITQAAEGQ